jgi:hypothetical protein
MDIAPSNDPQSIEIPGEVIAAGEDGKVFPFSATEDKFLVALSDTHDIGQAAEKIGKDMAWAARFFRKPKNREWISLKSRQHAAKSGTTQEWFYAYGRAVLAGKFEWWDGVCTSCGCKVKTYIEPMNERTLDCYLCTAPVLMTKQEILIKPTREQITVWQELGQRCSPKIERVSHEFVDSEFMFVARNSRDQEEKDDD